MSYKSVIKLLLEKKSAIQMQILEVFKVTFYFEKLGIFTFCKKKILAKVTL